MSYGTMPDREEHEAVPGPRTSVERRERFDEDQGGGT